MTSSERSNRPHQEMERRISRPGDGAEIRAGDGCRTPSSVPLVKPTTGQDGGWGIIYNALHNDSAVRNNLLKKNLQDDSE